MKNSLNILGLRTDTSLIIKSMFYLRVGRSRIHRNWHPIVNTKELTAFDQVKSHILTHMDQG